MSLNFLYVPALLVLGVHYLCGYEEDKYPGRLTSSLFLETLVAASSLCSRLCWYSTSCRSCSWGTRTRLCQLSKDTRRSSPDSFSASKHHVYMEVVEPPCMEPNHPCYSRPCAEGHICFPVEGGTRHICQLRSYLWTFTSKTTTTSTNRTPADSIRTQNTNTTSPTTVTTTFKSTSTTTIPTSTTTLPPTSTAATQSGSASTPTTAITTTSLPATPSTSTTAAITTTTTTITTTTSATTTAAATSTSTSTTSTAATTTTTTAAAATTMTSSTSTTSTSTSTTTTPAAACSSTVYTTFTKKYPFGLTHTTREAESINTCQSMCTSYSVYTCLMFTFDLSEEECWLYKETMDESSLQIKINVITGIRQC